MAARDLVFVRTIKSINSAGSPKHTIEELLVELRSLGENVSLKRIPEYAPSFLRERGHAFFEVIWTTKPGDDDLLKDDAGEVLSGLEENGSVTLLVRTWKNGNLSGALLDAGFGIAGTMKRGKALTESAIKPHFPVSDFVKGPLAPVVILGRANVNLLAQVRALGRCGIPVFCVLTRGEPPLIAKLSRYVRGVFDARGATDEVIIALINRIHATAGPKPILFPGGDLDVSLIARIWPSVRGFCMVVSDPARCSEFNDKQLQIETVERVGIRAPASRTVSNPEELEKAILALDFPVISKPLELSRKGGFRGKILVAETASDLRAHLEPVLKKGAVSLLLQEYIPGGIENLLFALVTCGQQGEVKMSVTGRKLQDNTKGGMGIGETLPDRHLDFLVEKTFRAFGVAGVLGVEFKKHDVTGEYFYIESNFRPENIHSVAEAAGVNLQLGAYLACLDEAALYEPIPQRAATWSDYSLVALGNLKRRFKPATVSDSRKADIRDGVRTDALWMTDDFLPGLAWYLLKFISLFRRESLNLIKRLRH